MGIHYAMNISIKAKVTEAVEYVDLVQSVKCLNGCVASNHSVVYNLRVGISISIPDPDMLRSAWYILYRM